MIGSVGLAEQHRAHVHPIRGDAEDGAQFLLPPEIAKEAGSDAGVHGRQKQKHGYKATVDEPVGDGPVPDAGGACRRLVRLAVAICVGIDMDEQGHNDRGPGEPWPPT